MVKQTIVFYKYFQFCFVKTKLTLICGNSIESNTAIDLVEIRFIQQPQ